jgi:hypothetical protein
LKKLGHDVEISLEIAKEICYDNSLDTLNDVIYIIGEQHRRLYRFIGKTEYIVTDCPLIQTLPYMYYESRLSHYKDRAVLKNQLENLVVAIHNQIPSINIYLRRDMDYKGKGRNENEQQADAVAGVTLGLLSKHKIEYHSARPISTMYDIRNIMKEHGIGI